MAAKKKPLDVRPAQLGKVNFTVETMALPPERTGGRIVGEGVDAVAELVRLLRTEAKVLDGDDLRIRGIAGRCPSKVALEAVTAARQAADASGGGEVHALVVGAPGSPPC